MFACAPDEPFDREGFENKWWGIQQYPICFNFHFYEDPELLTYEGRIENRGPWEFVEPNQYEVADEKFTITANDDCWKVDGYKAYNVDACECTLIPWQHTRSLNWNGLVQPVENKK
jgi:hypothetical protein